MSAREDIRRQIRDMHLSIGATVSDANEIADLAIHAAETARTAMNEVCSRGSNSTVVLSALITAPQVAAALLSAAGDAAMDIVKQSGAGARFAEATVEVSQ